jgi:hypothetical protein
MKHLFKSLLLAGAIAASAVAPIASASSVVETRHQTECVSHTPGHFTPNQFWDCEVVIGRAEGGYGIIGPLQAGQVADPDLGHYACVYESDQDWEVEGAYFNPLSGEYVPVTCRYSKDRFGFGYISIFRDGVLLLEFAYAHHRQEVLSFKSEV